VAGSEWAFRADEQAIVEALGDGSHSSALREYFGSEAYPELRRLAQRAKDSRSRRGPSVLIVPGIMGSRLGGPVGRGRTPRVLWIDPKSIATGGVRDLKLPNGRCVRPMGVLLYAYAKLLLELRIAGFEASLHAYDWRLGLDELGAALAARIRAGGEPLHLIGHSMGGMVARMALGGLPRRWVRKFIMLGTPNFGSFAPVQALRGTYPFVRKVLLLDPHHSPEELAGTVFNTFPGLYQLLPPPDRLGGADLYARRGWPGEGPAPRMDLLAQVAAVRARLAPPDARMAQIVGVNRPTVVGIRRRAAGFDYELDIKGDGTVPIGHAALPGLATYFVEEWHADLANNPQVIRAVVDLLRRGRTRALPRRWRAPRQRAARRGIDDAALRALDGPKIDWLRLNAAQRAHVLRALSE
jgi:pimeloyl-ACP methyl ester carboxylesterase